MVSDRRILYRTPPFCESILIIEPFNRHQKPWIPHFFRSTFSLEESKEVEVVKSVGLLLFQYDYEGFVRYLDRKEKSAVEMLMTRSSQRIGGEGTWDVTDIFKSKEKETNTMKETDLIKEERLME